MTQTTKDELLGEAYDLINDCYAHLIGYSWQTNEGPALPEDRPKLVVRLLNWNNKYGRTAWTTKH